MSTTPQSITMPRTKAYSPENGPNCPDPNLDTDGQETAHSAAPELILRLPESTLKRLSRLAKARQDSRESVVMDALHLMELAMPSTQRQRSVRVRGRQHSGEEGGVSETTAAPSVREIVESYLLREGYDGLSNGECGCYLGDLIPCEGMCPNVLDECMAGHTHIVTEEDLQDEERDFGGAEVGDRVCVAGRRPDAHVWSSLRYGFLDHLWAAGLAQGHAACGTYGEVTGQTTGDRCRQCLKIARENGMASL